MIDIKEFVKNNSEYLTIIGLILGIFGVVLAFIFYFKSKSKKKLIYHIRSFNLINEEISELNELEVIYKEKKIKNLTISKVALWNSGNITIDKTDIVSLDKLKITTADEVEVFEAEVISQVDPTNNFTLNKGDNEIELNFDYIDPNQGCAIKLYHTGKNSSDISLTGKIKGAGAVENAVISTNTRMESRFRNLQNKPYTPQAVLGSMFLITFKVGWILYLITALGTGVFSFYMEDYRLLLVTTFCLFGMVVLFPKRSLPKELDKIFSDEK